MDDAAAERLIWARNKAGFRSARAAAKSLGIPESTYRAYEGATRGFDLPQARQFSRRFQVPALWLFANEGQPPKGYGDPISVQSDFPEQSSSVSSVTGRRGVPEDAVVEADLSIGAGAGGTPSMYQSDQLNGISVSAESVRDYWRLPDWLLRSRLNAKPQHIVCFPTQGDSMAPTISDGDVVFVDTRHRVPSPPGIYVLADPFGGVIVKRLEIVSKPHEEQMRVKVASDNPRHETQILDAEEVYIIGRYVGRFTF